METKQYAAAGPWISVEERLPEASRTVLIKCGDDWGIGYRRHGTWFGGGLSNMLDATHCTHWAEVRV